MVASSSAGSDPCRNPGPGGGHQGAEFGVARPGDHHGEPAVADPGLLGRDGVDQGPAQLVRGHPPAPRGHAGGPGRRRRRGRRVDRGQHVAGHGHDLGRRPVVHGELGGPPAAGRVLVEQLGPGPHPGVGAGLGEVADQRHRPAGAAAHQHPPLHRRQLLCLVDDDVTELPGAVGRGALANGAGGLAMAGPVHHQRDERLDVERVDGQPVRGELAVHHLAVYARCSASSAARWAAARRRCCTTASVSPSRSAASSSSATSARVHGVPGAAVQRSALGLGELGGGGGQPLRGGPEPGEQPLWRDVRPAAPTPHGPDGPGDDLHHGGGP